MNVQTFSTASSKCQICAEGVTAHDPTRHEKVKRHVPYLDVDNRVKSASVMHLCGAKCPAVLCLGCFQKHVKELLDTVVPSVLPKICCPVCQTAMNKARWEYLSTQDVVDKYEWLCHMACLFLIYCDGCDEPGCPTKCQDCRSLLPCFPGEQAKDDPMERWPRSETHTSVWLVPAAKRKVPAFVELCRKFSNHRATADQVVCGIEDITSYGKDRLRESLYCLVMMRLKDEERRAELLLTYHAKYNRICCMQWDEDLCFRCRHWVYRSEGSDTHYYDEIHPDATTCKEKTVVVPVVECPFKRHHNFDAFWCPCGVDW